VVVLRTEAHIDASDKLSSVSMATACCSCRERDLQCKAANQSQSPLSIGVVICYQRAIDYRSLIYRLQPKTYSQKLFPIFWATTVLFALAQKAKRHLKNSRTVAKLRFVLRSHIVTSRIH